jgi:hypothetical protein
MRMKVCVWTLAVVLGSMAIPAAAHADILLSPFAGVTFGGDANAHARTVGGAVTFVGRSIGLELEAGRTNNFFRGDQSGTDVTNLSLSFVAGADLRGRGVKPYFLAGAGLLRTRVKGTAVVQDVHYNDFAIDLALGVNALVSDHFGFRGEVRYFRRLERASENGVIPIAGNFDFFRAIVGLDVHF